MLMCHHYFLFLELGCIYNIPAVWEKTPLSIIMRWVLLKSPREVVLEIKHYCFWNNLNTPYDEKLSFIKTLWIQSSQLISEKLCLKTCTFLIIIYQTRKQKSSVNSIFNVKHSQDKMYNYSASAILGDIALLHKYVYPRSCLFS